ncbi:MAG TPA: ABC transporter permease [Vicinamibacterales bacterium]|nr:ABC transporter permease [Vicinamibacterales bacterium]
MRRLRGWIRRAVAPIAGGRSDADIDAELRSHLELHTDDNIRAGMTPDEARRRAWIALGGVERSRDAYRDQRGFPMLDAIVRDIRHAARALVKSPGFTTTAIAILGLGIGANAAIFSVVNAVVLRPLPFPDASRLVRVWHTPPREQFPGVTRFSVSPANYLDWQAESTAFEHMAVYGYREANLTGRGEPDALQGAGVSSEFFEVLRAAPILGRVLGPGDEDPVRSHVVVLGEHIWRTRFGADPSFVGQAVTLNGEPYTVVGVLADRMRFPLRADVWLPLAWNAEERAVRGNHNYLVVARLKATADVRQANAELATISQRLERQYPADDKGWGAIVLPLQQDIVSDVRVGLLVLLGAVACVLLIACANLANLLLARGLGRSREIAIRAAVGASRARIVQQLLVESSLLAASGAAVGLAAAAWSIGLITKSFGATLPRASEVALDGRVLLYTCIVAIVTGLLAGVAPAWRMTRGDAGEALKQGMGRGGSHAGERRVRNVLVTAEVALALILLVGAGLLIRTLAQLRAVNPGIDPHHVVTMGVVLSRAEYDKPQRAQFSDEMLRRVRALPGVEAAATIDSLPVDDGGSMQPVAIEGDAPRPLSEQPEMAVRAITPGYLDTVRMRLRDGRDFTDADRDGRPPVVLVSASTAHRFWPGRSPVGQRLVLGLLDSQPREVVGVVSDVKVHGLQSTDTQTIYVPYAQVRQGYETLVVRSAGDPMGVVPAVVGAIRSINPGQPVVDIATMDSVIGESIAQQRFAMRLLSAFASLALLLGAIGIYGVLSYGVRQRITEIGIRMALGARALDVVRMVIVEGLKPTIVGVAIGVAGALALGQALSSLVFGVTPRDAATFVVVSMVVLGVGLVASIVPAYRATRVDPLLALRAD